MSLPDRDVYLRGLVRGDLRKKLRNRRALIAKFGEIEVDYDRKIRYMVDVLHDLGGALTDESANIDREMLAAALNREVAA